MTCSACHQRRKFVQHRPRSVTTLMGPIRYERAYDCGCRCGGWTPLDESLQLVDQLTWGAAEVVTLHGALCSFDEAATKALPRASGLRLSASTVQRIASHWSDDEQAACAQAHPWCHALKHSGGKVLLAEREALDLTGCSALVCEEHRRLCGYLGNNLYRTDSPRYLANGWQIGSGTIESACKNVGNGRLNGPGMRWSEPGTSHLCRVRALFKSEPSAWHNFWRHPPKQLAA